MMKPRALTIGLLLVTVTLCLAEEGVRSEAAGMLLSAPPDGRRWEDRGDVNGPELYSWDAGGPRIGALALRIAEPPELGFVEGRQAGASVLLDYLERIVEESYTEVEDPAGPYYFGDDGPLVVSLEFVSGKRYYREYLIWDDSKLYNLTIWCRSGLQEGLAGMLDALLAGFRW
ncbi:MAG: hypothetical protein GF399_09185 [Candidatus Coatesbacteria bacterium]|nr:hypothetical protein [Candidatus Coatesbacteria bacterium]